MRILRWAIINSLILAMFILGNIYSIEWMLTVATILLWLTAIVGILLLITYIFATKVFIDAARKSKPFSVPYIVDLSYDAITLFAMLYFGFIWLSFGYLLQMLSLALVAHYRN